MLKHQLTFFNMAEQVQFRRLNGTLKCGYQSSLPE